MKNKLAFLFLFPFFISTMTAQDLKGAHIRSKWVSGFSYSISVTVFSDPQSGINRQTIPIFFGDGQNGTFTLSATVTGSNTIQKTYSGMHTYAGAGTYNTVYLDSFRVAGIKNMSNSQTQKLLVEASIVINNTSANNVAPVPAFYPFYTGPANPALFNPAFADADGDSLSYSLVNCTGLNYYLPAGMVMNSTSGLLTFLKDTAGLYAFSFKIKEWRKNTSGVYKLLASSQIDFVMDITGTLGVKSPEESEKIMFYPNPVADVLYISSGKTGLENYKVEIITTSGQSVFQSLAACDLNVAQLSKGLYVLKLSKNNLPAGTFLFIKD